MCPETCNRDGRSAGRHVARAHVRHRFSMGNGRNEGFHCRTCSSATGGRSDARSTRVDRGETSLAHARLVSPLSHARARVRARA